MATTCQTNSFRKELLFGGHCFAATQSGVAYTSAATAVIAGLTTAQVDKLVLGMAISGGNWAGRNAVIASIDSGTQVTASNTPSAAQASATFTADVFKLLLVKVGPSGAYDKTLANVGTPGTGAASVTNVGTDEVTGTGYTSGGFALTNVNPTITNNVALTNFSVNPSWTSATISTIAAVIYNTTVRKGDANGIAASASGSAVNRTVSVHDFGGTQTVNAGTLTLVMPTADDVTAILRIS